jgi:hypothetical protein
LERSSDRRGDDPFGRGWVVLLEQLSQPFGVDAGVGEDAGERPALELAM